MRIQNKFKNYKLHYKFFEQILPWILHQNTILKPLIQKPLTEMKTYTLMRFMWTSMWVPFLRRFPKEKSMNDSKLQKVQTKRVV